MNIDKIIANNIVLAQAASDRGKGLQFTVENRGVEYMGYEAKPIYIKRALDSINSVRKSRFTYWVIGENDQNGRPSVLVYFEFSMGGVKGQVSFHTPWKKADALKEYIGKGTPTEWNGVIGGSRNCCEWLAEKYDL